MNKKFLASLILVCTLCGVANASVSDYVSGIGDTVSGWFSKKERKLPKKKDEILTDHLAKEWDELTEDLTKALQLRDKQDNLPRNSWIPFKEDQLSNAKKINAILDEALKILINGQAGEMRHESILIQEMIAKQRLELDELRNKKITAPESSYAFWKLTKDKADKRIAELEEAIRVEEERLTVINLNLTHELNQIGLELDTQQTEILLNSVTGEDLLQNTMIFSNVKLIVAKLENLSQNDTNSFEINRRYTGMYLVLNDLLIHTQEELVKKIDREYKPKLDAILIEARQLRQDALTKSRQNTYTKAQREAFTANAKSNELTIQVAELYEKLLRSQRTSTLKGIENMRRNRDVAENTYKTVRSSGELRGLIHTGLNLFDAIDGLSMPELKIFESGAMRMEFEEINRRLKKE